MSWKLAPTVILALFVAICGCAPDRTERHLIRLEVPGRASALSGLSTLSSRSALSSRVGTHGPASPPAAPTETKPQSLDDISCVFLNVTGEGIAPYTAALVPLAEMATTPYCIYGGALSAPVSFVTGGTLALEVEAGSARRIQVMGMKTATGACPALPTPAQFELLLTTSGSGVDFEPPFILGEATVDVFSDVNLDIQVAFDATAPKSFASCFKKEGSGNSGSTGVRSLDFTDSNVTSDELADNAIQAFMLEAQSAGVSNSDWVKFDIPGPDQAAGGLEDYGGFCFNNAKWMVDRYLATWNLTGQTEYNFCAGDGIDPDGAGPLTSADSTSNYQLWVHRHLTTQWSSSTYIDTFGNCATMGGTGSVRTRFYMGGSDTLGWFAPAYCTAGVTCIGVRPGATDGRDLHVDGAPYVAGSTLTFKIGIGASRDEVCGGSFPQN